MNSEKITYEEIKYVKLVSVGSVNPNNPLSDNSREKQVELLNRCLNDYPKGIIIGKDTTIGRYVIGEHELSMEKVTYHIGFSRKPGWADIQNKKECGGNRQWQNHYLRNWAANTKGKGII
ncbi:MAG: hypothetical protein V8R67_04140 [Eubacterium sp.]